MKKTLFIIFLASFCLNTTAQTLINDQDYNDLNNWEYYSKIFRKNNTQDLNKNKVFQIGYSKKKNGRYKNKLHFFELESSFAIPQDSIHFSFDCNSIMIDSLSITINLYQENEVVDKSFTYKLDMNGLNKISFKNEDATLMDVIIYGNSMRTYDSISLMITEFDIYASKHNLSESLKQFQPKINNLDITLLPLINSLEEFKTKKIIGLGESVHGSQAITSCKKEMIKQLCEDKTVKLVCFEAPVDMVMNWDLYIQGILPESYQQKIKDEVNGSFDNANIQVELLNRLRKINQGRAEADKIHVVGLDLRTEIYYVFEYFKAIMSTIEDEELIYDILLSIYRLDYNTLGHQRCDIPKDTCYWTEIPPKRRYPTLIEKIGANEKLKTIINYKNYSFLKEVILAEIPTAYDAAREDYEKIKGRRDEYMWEIFQHAAACYAPGEKDRIILDMHSMHLSKTYNPHSINHLAATKNLGVYIFETYAEKFHSVSFHVGEGKYKSHVKGIVDESPLQSPIYGSFEWAAGKLFFDRFYCRNVDIAGKINSFRSISNYPRALQFNALSKNRFDGYVYIAETDANFPIKFDESTSMRFSEMSRYMDSVRIKKGEYKTSFDYDIYIKGRVAPIDITMPKEFRWKDVYMHTYGWMSYGQQPGFFESKDEHCIIFIDNYIRIKGLPQGLPHEYETTRAADIISEVGRTIFPSRIDLKKELGNPSILWVKDKDKELLDQWQSADGKAVAYKYLNFKPETYAKKVFNADRVATIPLDSRIGQIIGPYTYGEAVLIEKDEKTICLMVFYTEEGFKNKAKYDKTIESLVRFK